MADKNGQLNLNSDARRELRPARTRNPRVHENGAKTRLDYGRISTRSPPSIQRSDNKLR